MPESHQNTQLEMMVGHRDRIRQIVLALFEAQLHKGPMSIPWVNV
jgi:hypothetical protein